MPRGLLAGLLLALTSVALAEPPTLRAVLAEQGITLGTSVQVAPLDDPEYRALLQREYAALTPESAMKWSVLEPAPGRYDFSGADAVLDFAARHGLSVDGHVLLWHDQLPPWLLLTQPETRAALLQRHVATVVGRYRGRIAVWDVAAEAVADDGSPRDTHWRRALGADYLAHLFRWAHAADPEALLRYNDYGGEDLGAKSDGIYQLLKGLLAQGVPVHAVGLQAHFNTDWAPSRDTLIANMQRLGALGLAVHVTELDVGVPQPPSRADLQRQLAIYRDVIAACAAVTACTRISTWGASDRYSWVPEFFPGWGGALLFDQDGQPKTVYRALVNDGRN